ncbi:MAG: LPS assembly lipoprotein LptE [Woeseiaceae bacterium]
MFRQAFLVTTMLLWLTGCGFHLQGQTEVPEEMQRTYIATDDEYSIFYRELRRQLEANGIEVVSSSVDASATLSIHLDDTGQRVLSVSARNVPTEYEVFYTIEYSVASGEAALQPRQFISLTKDYTYDETLVLGKAQEEQVLREAIAADLARTVLRQLGSL